MHYPADMEANELRGFNGAFMDVPEAITFGNDREHALAMPR